MIRFILNLLLVYVLISVIMIISVILISKRDRCESSCPRKMLYVVNMTDDSISVSISGAYTEEEQRMMGDKPDEYIFTEDTQTLPYHWIDGEERQAAGFRIPHKYNTEIEFPNNFMLHIKSAKREITLNKNDFENYINHRFDQNWWAVYVEPQWLEPPKPEVVDTTVFTANGIRYHYLPEPGEVEVIHSIPGYKDSVFIPTTVNHKGRTYLVTAIGDYAMAGDKSAALRLMIRGVFKGNSGLRKVSFPDSLRTIGREAFTFCTVLETFTFPETLETIGEWAFEHCWAITSVTIPPRVSVIRVRTFNGCRNLECVTLPHTVTSIEALAFAQCRSLKSVEVNWQTPIELTEEDSPFKCVNLSRATLTVPAGTKRLYQTAPVWKEFGNIVESKIETKLIIN